VCAQKTRFAGPPISAPANQSASREGFAGSGGGGFILRDRRRAEDTLPRGTQTRATTPSGHQNAKGTGEAAISFSDFTASIAADLLSSAAGQSAVSTRWRQGRSASRTA